MGRTIRSLLVLVSLLAALALSGCSKESDTTAPPVGGPEAPQTGRPGTPKQTNANAALEAPAAAPSGVQTGNYAGGRK